jgi:hypothetical protein
MIIPSKTADFGPRFENMTSRVKYKRASHLGSTGRWLIKQDQQYNFHSLHPRVCIDNLNDIRSVFTQIQEAVCEDGTKKINNVRIT